MVGQPPGAGQGTWEDSQPAGRLVAWDGPGWDRAWPPAKPISSERSLGVRAWSQSSRAVRWDRVARSQDLVLRGEGLPGAGSSVCKGGGVPRVRDGNVRCVQEQAEGRDKGRRPWARLFCVVHGVDVEGGQDSPTGSRGLSPCPVADPSFLERPGGAWRVLL